jgi:hypothetical protein
VLRNSKGGVLAGSYNPMNHMLSATSAEALALLKGLELLEILGCTKVIIKSDKVATKLSEVWSTYSETMAECFLKANSIDQVSLQHCYRDDNHECVDLAPRLIGALYFKYSKKYFKSYKKF